MPEVVVRKKLTCVEEIFHEGGPGRASPSAAGRGTGGDPKSVCGIVCGRTSKDSWMI